MNYFPLILLGMFVFGTTAVVIPASASCPAEHEGPCFDSYMGVSDEEMSQEWIINHFSRNIDTNYENWKPGDSEWSPIGTPLELPAIICTSYVVNGTTHYGMMKWEEPAYVSSMERYRDDSMCDVWLSPNTNVAQEDILIQSLYFQSIIDAVDSHAKEMSDTLSAYTDIDESHIIVTIDEEEYKHEMSEFLNELLPEGYTYKVNSKSMVPWVILPEEEERTGYDVEPLLIKYSDGIISQTVLILIAISFVPIIGYVIYQTKKKSR